ncbi:hypothetical protein DIE11_33410 [Burkholderia sp. Bp9012]|uniref:HutD/Ves family protein n=1 Tax=Burkholderia sp. Bp9012 TaxID=2184562 RepID=UPI000F5A9F1E|nr:HutD family protein [Burkholderia sp. Bp9012]RQR69259.1 hypothetical protein DIE11_33410 [Burkholderia sp. Bp9012]
MTQASPDGDSAVHPAPSSHRYPSVQFVDCVQIVPEAWANGAGVTRTVARRISADGDADWRVSLATLDGSARFSQFPGMDRTLVPIDDTQVELNVQDGQLIARSTQPACFPGDLLVWTSGMTRSTTVLNVMTRRDACRAAVTVTTHSRRITPAPAQLLISASGQWRVESSLLSAVSLGSMQGLWVEGRVEELDLRPVAPGSRLILIAIHLIPH